jgi:hypothetical protein
LTVNLEPLALPTPEDNCERSALGTDMWGEKAILKTTFVV